MIHIASSLSLSLTLAISSPSEQGKSRSRGHWVKNTHKWPGYSTRAAAAADLRISGITNSLYNFFILLYTVHTEVRINLGQLGSKKKIDPPLSTSLTPLSLNGQMTVTFQLFTWPIQEVGKHQYQPHRPNIHFSIYLPIFILPCGIYYGVKPVRRHLPRPSDVRKK